MLGNLFWPELMFASTPISPRARSGTDRRRDGCCWRPDETGNVAPPSVFPIASVSETLPLKLPSALIDCLLMSFWDFVECEHSDAVPSLVENIGLPALAVQCGSLDTKGRRFVWV